MTRDFRDPFTCAEIRYRQDRVSADWAWPGDRRRRGYRLKVAEWAVRPPASGQGAPFGGFTAQVRRHWRVSWWRRPREEPQELLVVPWSKVRTAPAHDRQIHPS